MWMEYFVIVLVFSVVNNQEAFSKDQILDLIASNGYKGEVHYVTTEDGYILKMHRIVPKHHNQKKPVFLFHGILATSADFLITGKDIAIAYLLSDAGYDIWLGNSRGSKHSLQHRFYSSNSDEFWNFSWHEMGIYDIPAMIDFILYYTKSSSCFYIGHSQGTTSFLVSMSSNPEYNHKISQAHLLAAPAFRKKLPKSRVDRHDEIRFLELRRMFKIGEKIGKTFCRDNNLLIFKLCKILIKLTFGGSNSDKELEIETKILPNLVRYLSPKVSTMQLTHYYQNMISNRFRQFDYKQDNFAIYNASEPPDYRLDLISAPVYLYHAEHDNFITEKGVAYLKTLLPNVRKYRVMKDWNHIDFVYSKNSREVLYKDILNAFNQE